MAAVDTHRPVGAVDGWKVEVIKEDDGENVMTSMKVVDNAYDKAEALGEGTYGTVIKGICKKTGDVVALKRIRMDNEKEGFPLTALREIRLLSKLNHQNIINLREVVRSKATRANGYKPLIYMVFDYMDHDLTGLMERRDYHFPAAQLKCYMLQLFRGLHYIHKNNILHRDLKASNLLTNNQGILKIADFGLARQYDGTKHKETKERAKRPAYTVRVITLWYRPLELLLGSPNYGPEIDMWSAGCILAELLCGKPLFPGKDEIDQIDKIISVLGTPTEETLPGVSTFQNYKMVETRKVKPNELRKKLLALADDRHKPLLTEKALDLVEKLLTLDPEKRLAAADACMHDYFYEHPEPMKPEDMPTYEASHEMKMKQKRKAAEAQGQRGAQRPRYDQQHNRQHHGGHNNRGGQGRQNGPYRGPPGPPAGPGGAYNPQYQPHNSRATSQVSGQPRGPPGPPPPMPGPMAAPMGRAGYPPVVAGSVPSYQYPAGPGGYAVAQGVPHRGPPGVLPPAAPFSAGGGYGAGGPDAHVPYRGPGGPQGYNMPHAGPYRGPPTSSGDRRGPPADQRHGPTGPRPTWESQRR